MSEENNGVTSNNEVAPEIQHEAESQGWVPKEKFRGNEADWVDADGKSFTFENLMSSNSIIEGDHQSARAKGNETSTDNLVLRNKKANIRKSDKIIAC